MGRFLNHIDLNLKYYDVLKTLFSCVVEMQLLGRGGDTIAVINNSGKMDWMSN